MLIWLESIIDSNGYDAIDDRDEHTAYCSMILHSDRGDRAPARPALETTVNDELIIELKEII